MARCRLRRTRAAIILMLSFIAPVAAGPLEDAVAAKQRGDYETTLQLLRPLADQGDADAQTELGYMFWNGDGVRQNDDQAISLFRRAADQGNATAQAQLGFLHRHGIGLLQDYVLAHMWSNLSAAQGNNTGAVNRDLLLQLMTREQIAEAQKLARDWRLNKRPQ